MKRNLNLVDIDNIKRNEKEKGLFINVNMNNNIGKRNENNIKGEKSGFIMSFALNDKPIICQTQSQ